MAHVLIIGYGNPLRGDDGLGWVAARRIEKEFAGEEMRVITSHQLTPELALDVSQADLVLFIDASMVGTPGAFVCQPIAAAKSDQLAMTHHFEPANLFAFSQELYGGHANAFLLSIVGDCFDYVERLSPVVLDTIPELMRRVNELIQSVQ
ncbi:MAG: hydrogenase maturation protease [Candidatus Omnitrophota bacterium]|jgi:hydrogenase maturation protease|nr:MAG: hydrogenase maturation protease [Candidatus Omnitrophota bacterium]